MKKLTSLLAVTSFLTSASSALAQSVDVGIKVPRQGINPDITIGTLLSNVLTIIFVAAAILVLVFLIIGAFQWITSGGDKEAVGKARQRIIAALVGLVILALAFLITRIVGDLVNIDILNLNQIPALDDCTGKDEVFDPESGTCQPKVN